VSHVFIKMNLLHRIHKGMVIISLFLSTFRYWQRQICWISC